MPRALLLCLIVLSMGTPQTALAADAIPPAGDPSPIASAPRPEAPASPYVANRVDSLHHRPTAGRWVVDAGVSGSPRDTTATYPASLIGGSTAPSSTSRTTAAALQLGAEFAVTDALYLSLADSAGFSLTTVFPDAKSPASTFHAAAGPSSPTLGVNYRAIGNLQDSVFLDLSLSYTPTFGGVQLAEQGSTGSRLSPFHSVGASMRVVAVAGDAEFASSLSVHYNLSGSFHSATPGGSYTSAPFTTGGATVQARFHFLDSFFSSVWAGLNTGNTINYTSTSGNTQLTPSLSTAPYAPLGADLGWRASQRLVLTLSYTYAAMQRVAPLSGDAATFAVLGFGPTRGHIDYVSNAVDLGLRVVW